jgi:hypothetical protein
MSHQRYDGVETVPQVGTAATTSQSGVCARGQCSYGSEADLRILLLGAWMVVHNASSQEQRGLLSYFANLRGGIDQQLSTHPKVPRVKIRE